MEKQKTKRMSHLRTWWILTVSLVFVVFSAQPLLAQEDYKNDRKRMKAVEEMWEQQRYQEALPIYENLVSNYPKDPNYNYRYGACLLYSSEDKSAPGRYLEFAVSRPVVENEAYFFLGKYYHLNYEFQKALKYLEKYEFMTTKENIEKYEVKSAIRQCKNGLELFNSVTDLIVLERRKLRDEDFYRAYDLSQFNGKLLFKPDEFKSSHEVKEGLKGLMIMRPKAETIYFSSETGNPNKGKDIFYATKTKDGWSKPINIGGSINTAYDDDFPFLHPDGKTLYFASKGHNSMGGYDIFVSRWDETSRMWGTPENLDYAINSPDDDYLFITDSSAQTAVFSSKRASTMNEVYYYKINLNRQPLDFSYIVGEFVAAGGKRAKITVEDATTGEKIGSYSTDPVSGSYKIRLPNEGKFTFLVDYSKSDVLHSGTVELKGVDPFVPVKQQMLLENEGQDNEQLTIKNLFDEEVDEKDFNKAEVFAANAKLEVNKDDYAATLEKLENEAESQSTESPAEAAASEQTSSADAATASAEGSAEEGGAEEESSTDEVPEPSLVTSEGATNDGVNEPASSNEMAEDGTANSSENSSTSESGEALAAGNETEGSTSATGTSSTISNTTDASKGAAIEEPLGSYSEETFDEETPNIANDEAFEVSPAGGVTIGSNATPQQAVTAAKANLAALALATELLSKETAVAFDVVEKEESTLKALQTKRAATSSEAEQKELDEQIAEQKGAVDQSKEIASELKTQVDERKRALSVAEKTTNSIIENAESQSPENYQSAVYDLAKFTERQQTKNIDLAETRTNIERELSDAEVTKASSEERLLSLETSIAQKESQREQLTNSLEQESNASKKETIQASLDMLEGVIASEEELIEQTKKEKSDAEAVIAADAGKKAALNAFENEVSNNEDILAQQAEIAALGLNVKTTTTTNEIDPEAAALAASTESSTESTGTSTEEETSTESTANETIEEATESTAAAEASDGATDDSISNEEGTTSTNEETVPSSTQPAGESTNELAAAENGQREDGEATSSETQGEGAGQTTSETGAESGDENTSTTSDEVASAATNITEGSQASDTESDASADEEPSAAAVGTTSPNEAAQATNRSAGDEVLARKLAYYDNADSLPEQRYRNGFQPELTESELKKDDQGMSAVNGTGYNKRYLDNFIGLVEEPDEQRRVALTTVLNEDWSADLSAEINYLEDEMEKTVDEDRVGRLYDRIETLKKIKKIKERDLASNEAALQQMAASDPNLDIAAYKASLRDEVYDENSGEWYQEPSVSAPLAAVGDDTSSEEDRAASASSNKEETYENELPGYVGVDDVSAYDVSSINENAFWAGMDGQDPATPLHEEIGHHKETNMAIIENDIAEAEKKVEELEKSYELSPKKQRPEVLSQLRLAQVEYAEAMAAKAFEEYREQSSKAAIEKVKANESIESYESKLEKDRRNAYVENLKVVRETQEALETSMAKAKKKERPALDEQLQDVLLEEALLEAKIAGSHALVGELVDYEERTKDALVVVKDTLPAPEKTITLREAQVIASRPEMADFKAKTELSNLLIKEAKVAHVKAEEYEDLATEDRRKALLLREEVANMPVGQEREGKILEAQVLEQEAETNVKKANELKSLSRKRKKEAVVLNNQAIEILEASEEPGLPAMAAALVTYESNNGPVEAASAEQLAAGEEQVEEAPSEPSTSTEEGGLEEGESLAAAADSQGTEEASAPSSEGQAASPEDVSSEGEETAEALSTEETTSPQEGEPEGAEAEATTSEQSEEESTSEEGVAAGESTLPNETDVNEVATESGSEEGTSATNESLTASAANSTSEDNAREESNNDVSTSTTVESSTETGTQTQPQEQAQEERSFGTSGAARVPIAGTTGQSLQSNEFKAVGGATQYSEDNPIPIDNPLPSGLVYKVQIGAFSRPVSPDKFKGFEPIRGETSRPGVIRYTAGLFNTFSPANGAKNNIRSGGYPDAYVVAYYNGKRVPVWQAREIEAGNIPESLQQSSGGGATPVVQAEPTNLDDEPIAPVEDLARVYESSEVEGLLYTVQIGAYSKPVTSADLFNLSPIIAYRKDGLVKYNVGVYNSIPKAVTAKNEVVRIGIKDAFVTAFYNGERVSLDEAKQIAEEGGESVFAEQPEPREPESNEDTPEEPVVESPVEEPAATTPEEPEANTSEEEEPTNNEASPENEDEADAGNEIPDASSYTVELGRYAGEVPIRDAKIILGLSADNLVIDEQGEETVYKLTNITSKTEAVNVMEEMKNKGLSNANVQPE